MTTTRQTPDATTPSSRRRPTSTTLSLDDPLPSPPRAARTLAVRCRLRTVRDLVELDVKALATAPSAGPAGIAELMRWRYEIVRRVVTEGPDADGEDDDPTPLPPPPSLIAGMLDRAGVRTLGKLRRLTPLHAARIPGVGRTKLARFDAWRRDVLSPTTATPNGEGAPVPPRDRLTPEQLAAPLIAAPGLIRVLLVRHGVTTVGELLDFAAATRLPGPGLGPRRLECLGLYATDLVAQAAMPPIAPVEPPPAPPAPRTLAEAVEQAYACCSPADRELLAMRYRDARSLEACGQSRGVSRERARQVLARILSGLREGLGPVVGPLLEREYDVTAGRQILTPDASRDATIPFRALALPFDIVNSGWEPVAPDAWFRGSASAFRHLRIAVGRWANPLGEIRDDALAGAPADADIVRWVLAHDAGMRLDDGVWTLALDDLPRARWLAERFRQVARPVRLDEAARWHAERSGGAPERHPRVEAILDRNPALYRFDTGTFVHRDVVESTAPGLTVLVRWCVDRMRGSEEAWSVRVLLDLAARAGIPTEGVTPWLLKDALMQRPEVLPLRKLHVGFRETFAGADSVATHVREALRTAGEPLTIDAILARMPSTSAFSALTVGQVLREEARAGRAEARRTRAGNVWSTVRTGAEGPRDAREAVRHVWDAWRRDDYAETLARADHVRRLGDAAQIAWVEDVVTAAREAVARPR